MAIIWDKEEWRKVALWLLERHPEYLHAEAVKPGAAELRAAMAATLPPERIRTKYSPNIQPMLLRVYAELRAEMATAVEIAQAAPDPAAAAPKKARRRKVYWNPAHFELMARHLRQRFPDAGFLDSPVAAGLERRDVTKAMEQALPPELHRDLNSLTRLRAGFVAAFRAIKAESYHAAERARMERQAAEQEAARLAAVQKEEQRAAAAAAATPVPLNPYEAAFAPILQPLVALFARQLAEHLGPQLVDAVLAALSSEAPAAPAGNDAAPAPGAAPRLMHLVPAPVTKPRRPHIGILGNRNTYKDDLVREFPCFEFTCIDTGRQIDSIRNADKVIVMISYVGHPDALKAKKVAGERHVPVNGNLTDLKRVIHGWTTDGTFAAASRAG
jgi:hypothetical protein